MPTTYLLKPEIIKHLRTRNKLKQDVVARLMGVTVRGYQKIERSGRTKPENADKLAETLGTTVAHLQGEADLQLYTPYWFITSWEDKKNKAGQIFHNFYEVCQHIDELLTQRAPHYPSEHNEISVVLTKEDHAYRLSVAGGHTGDFWLQFRRIELDRNRGLVWAYESELEADLMAHHLDQLLYETSTRYTRYGDVMPPKGARAAFRVDVITAGFPDNQKPLVHHHLGWRLFENQKALQSFISQYIRDFNPRDLRTDSEGGELRFELIPHIHFRDRSTPVVPFVHLVIRYCWTDSRGNVKGFAPWHRRSIENFRALINDDFQRPTDPRSRSRLPDVALETGRGELPRPTDSHMLHFKLLDATTDEDSQDA